MTSLWKKYCALVGLVVIAILGCNVHFSRPATQTRFREPVPLVRILSLETSKGGIKESLIDSTMTDASEALQRDGESDEGAATAEAVREPGVGETPRIQEESGEQLSVASQRDKTRRGAGASAVRGRAKNEGARVERGSSVTEEVASSAAADEEGGGSGGREAGEGGREAASPDSTGEAQQGGGKLAGASQSTQLRERYRKSDAAGMRCGGMPAAMRPAFVAQKTRSGRPKALLPAQSGSVTVYDAQGARHRVRTEHGSRPAVQEQPGQARGPGEKALAACLRNLNDCSEAAREASWALNGVRKAWLGTEKLLSKPYGSCAVVGNSGALNRAAYGSFIDAHDYVMRINALPLQGRGRNLGMKTSGRVLSNKISQMVCCHSKRYKPDSPGMEFHLWFPGTRETTAKRIRERFHVQAAGMAVPFLKSAVSAFKALRQDLLGLGYGPFEDWEFMTGGMHAVLGLLRSCDSLSLFGFTTDDTSAAAYWFTGQRHAPASGRRQHAWDHERMALRLLYAAGALDICTS